MTERVGLTGGIASGKSTVAGMLVELGAVVIDADVVAREVVARGTPGLAAIAEQFGRDVLTDEGDLDRPKLGAIVFADDAARERLNAITHPLVAARTAELEDAARATGRLVVNDIPLLVEVGYADLFDAVIVVDVPVELQVERAVARGMDEADVRSRIAAQATREQRRAAATYLIENTGTQEDLRQRVAEVFEQLTGVGDERRS